MITVYGIETWLFLPTFPHVPSWNDMITVYGIETRDGIRCADCGLLCWNDMITVYGIETGY